MVGWMVIPFPYGLIYGTHEWLTFDGKLADKYISPIDPMGNGSFVLRNVLGMLLSFQKYSSRGKKGQDCLRILVGAGSCAI